MLDRFGRSIDYMRISITDRCNLRCRYCMPEGVDLVPMREILTFEEIRDICTVGADLGIRKLKITGGEPLVRRGCPDLIRMLKAVPGIEQVTLTTNGILLEEQLPALLDAGLDAVNISLDAVDPVLYEAITGKNALASVRSSIEAVLSSPLPLKINAVLQKDLNDGEWYPLASLARNMALDVRFIELMPIGSARSSDGISNTELLRELKLLHPDLTEDPAVHGNGPAVYVRIPGWKGSVGFISAIHGKFCAGCNRIRLTSQGKLKPCLCYGGTTDLMPVLRENREGPVRDSLLRAALKQAVLNKPKQHCFEMPESITETSRMSSIGG